MNNVNKKLIILNTYKTKYLIYYLIMTDVVNQEHSESSHIYTKTYGNHTYMINIDDGKLIFNITSPSKLITTKIDDSFCKEYNLTKEDMS